MVTQHMARSPGDGASRFRLGSRLLAALTVVMLAIVVMAPSADAARAWCRTDPVVVLNGTLADVFVSGPLLAPLKVTGPTKMIVMVPEGVDTKLILNDLGFGRGYDFKFEHTSRLKQTDRGIEVVVRVYVPARDNNMPVKVEFSPRLLGLLSIDSVEGTANEWITLNTFLAKGLL